MKMDKSGLEEQENMKPNSPAEEQPEEDIENIADTQERADAIASATPEDSQEDETASAAEEAATEPPIENINTDDELGPEEAGELSGPPAESIAQEQEDTAAEDQPVAAVEAESVTEAEQPAVTQEEPVEQPEADEVTEAPAAPAEPPETEEAEAEQPAVTQEEPVEQVEGEEIAEAPAAPAEPPETEEAEAEQPAAIQEEPVEQAEGEEIAEEAPATPAEPPETEEADASGIRRGDVIEATVIKPSPTEVIVDLGDGREGMIPGRELDRLGPKMVEELTEGATVMVYVVNPHDHQGRVILSVNRAIEELDWTQAESYRAEQKAYDGHIAGYNKGGLIVRFGTLRGFVPQSQISDDRRRRMSGETPEERYSPMVNDSIVVKVMEVDRSRNRLILSERAAMRELREKRKEALIEDLEVGQVAEGHIVSLEDFGAFVDVGGAEGLVHLTEIAWKHVTHPREVLQIGQKVKVEVISVDRQRKRIGLSIKRQEADPWDEVATTCQVGDLVQATVTKLTKFGAFARLVDADDIEGLIHISELSDQRVNHPRDVVNENEKLTLRVVKIDVKNRRLGLSLKRVNSAEYLDRDLQTFASEADD
jgi:small subunit ribosomal protein S1